MFQSRRRTLQSPASLVQRTVLLGNVLPLSFQFVDVTGVKQSLPRHGAVVDNSAQPETAYARSIRPPDWFRRGPLHALEAITSSLNEITPAVDLTARTDEDGRTWQIKLLSGRFVRATQVKMKILSRSTMYFLSHWPDDDYNLPHVRRYPHSVAD